MGPVDGMGSPMETAAVTQRRLADAIEPAKAQDPASRGHPRLGWFRWAKFGAFIHWGLYALPDRWIGRPARVQRWTQEWVMQVRQILRAEYAALAGQFRAERFDADAWVRLFKQAGQRYVVFTAKHHDGFCMFATAQTDYNVVTATPLGRDVLAELAEACRRHGLALGIYYSQTQDWHHPDGHGNDWDLDPSTRQFDRYVQTYVKPQIRELLTRYGEVAILWFDTPMVMTAEQSAELRALVRELQPGCLVNGRVGHGLGDYATTRDNQLLTRSVEMDWECPATMNHTWGFNPLDEGWKPVEHLLADLRDVNAKQGNYLLNVGPDGDGAIPQASVERLLEIGRRLRADGWDAQSPPGA